MDNDDDCRDAENEAEVQEARAWVRNAALGPPCPALRRSLWALVTRSRGKGANGALSSRLQPSPGLQHILETSIRGRNVQTSSQHSRSQARTLECTASECACVVINASVQPMTSTRITKKSAYSVLWAY